MRNLVFYVWHGTRLCGAASNMVNRRKEKKTEFLVQNEQLQFISMSISDIIIQIFLSYFGYENRSFSIKSYVSLFSAHSMVGGCCWHLNIVPPYTSLTKYIQYSVGMYRSPIRNMENVVSIRPKPNDKNVAVCGLWRSSTVSIYQSVSVDATQESFLFFFKYGMNIYYATYLKWTITNSVCVPD